MAYFPFMIQLEDKVCLIVGGGKVAARKVETLLSFGATVRVVAPEICQELYERQDSSQGLSLRERAFEEADLTDVDVVIMATDDSALNSRVSSICKQRKILVNVVDVKEDCGFYFPAIIKQDEVVISVSTGGSSPALAARIKKEIQKHLRGDYGRIASDLGEVREQVLMGYPQEEKRREILFDMLEQRLEERVIRIGTRGSELARIQTNMVIEELRKTYPMYEYKTVILTTKGDRQTHRPITAFGGKAVFVEEIEQALLDGMVDIAVHSAKDMPNPCQEGLVIAGALPRACVQDVLIYPKEKKLGREDTFVVGTGSLRRRCQLQAMYPHAICQDLRGNIGTRLSKLQEGQYDAIVLAAAGIERQGLADNPDLYYEYLPVGDMIPAAGQGIIAIETREDSFVRSLVSVISDRESSFELQVERAVLTGLDAGCHEPVGVLSQLENERLQIDVMVVSDGKRERKKVTGKKDDWEYMVARLCEKEG